MTPILPRVYNIAPGGDFLDVLAKNILHGFPHEGDSPRVPLSRWTILLPTRRAARQLGQTLLNASKQKAILLPTIKPIGDLDQDQISNKNIITNLPNAITPSGQFFTILSLLGNWSAENPHITLAQEIAKSRPQAIALANSLVKLVDQIETEEVNFDKISEVYEADLSEHRNSILSLLSVVKSELPKQLHTENLIGPSEKRNRAIRLEAELIAQGEQNWPIIAAGSTGTIPATRALLLAIAKHRLGAVILPGLDSTMDDQAWTTLKPDHPQSSLKNLLNEFGLKRSEVSNLSLGNQSRNFLSSELMRPTETADQWNKVLNANRDTIYGATENMKLIEAPDRHLEARSIALILRSVLEVPNQTGALVTPDRDLAGRVRAELRRWNIEIDDSAGEPLVQSGLAALAQRLIQAFSANFSPASILSLLHHPLCDLGLDRSKMLASLNNLEIAVLRNYGVGENLRDLQSALDRTRLASLNAQRLHPLAGRLVETDWHDMQDLLSRITKLADGVDLHEVGSFKQHLSMFLESLQKCTTLAPENTAENQAFAEIIFEIEHEAHRIPESGFSNSLALILEILRKQMIDRQGSSHPRLIIYGLLEARMMPCDILILGGLNETKWPAQPDPGPWLNRPMRDIFGIQQPEREIGVSAHDFTQALGYNKVFLTWSKRVAAAPLIPSRWILRLKAVLQVAGIDPKDLHDQSWIEWSKAIDEAEKLLPHAKPKPTPPIAARRKQISVTEVETLIRDPYAVYARRVLKLEPLPQLSRQADAALRGTLFHSAINEWNKFERARQSHDSLDILLKAGQHAFAPFISDTDIASFWWPRFVRMASWLTNEENQYRIGVKLTETEIFGSVEFDIGQEKHTLYGTADRIDILESGFARIVDYKTGNPPSSKQVTSGFNPQLPLEAAILAFGKFGQLPSVQTDMLDYITVSGGKEAGEIKSITPTNGLSVAEIAEQKFFDLKKLLLSYQNPSQPYLPRVSPFKEEGEGDYDHLSRFREWMLGGEKL